MNEHEMEVAARVRMRALLDEAELRTLLRSIQPEPLSGRPWRARSPFAIVRRLTRVAGAS